LKILLDHQNNYVKRLCIYDTAAKRFNIPAINLNVLHNYFDGPTKLLADLYLAFRYLNKTVFFSRNST